MLARQAEAEAESSLVGAGGLADESKGEVVEGGVAEESKGLADESTDVVARGVAEGAVEEDEDTDKEELEHELAMPAPAASDDSKSPE